MRTKDDLHNYQKFGVEHIIKNPFCGLFLDMGLGKTATTLTAIDQLMNDYCEVRRVLVIAPKKVADYTWYNEINAWAHLKGLKLVKILGPAAQRKAALMKKADIYTINRENVEWLVAHLGGHWMFDMVVIDELSSFKNHQSKRFRALKMVRGKITRLVGLTGTPAPNGLLDLWSQLYLMDMGERLGRTITAYRDAYFKPGKMNGHVVYSYKPLEDSEQKIYDKIGDICVSMKAKDYLELPDRLDIDENIEFSADVMKKYLEFEKMEVLKLFEHDKEITTTNAAGLTNKLLQFSNGAVYDENKAVFEVHDEKMYKVKELIESANGKPVLLFYAYKHNIPRLQQGLKSFGEVRLLECNKDMDDWNEGKIDVLMAHPASAGHGLNLQHGGNVIIWFQLPWSLELYQQAVARLHRQGQCEVVRNYRLICKGTMDEDVLRALENKVKGQDALMEAVKARIDKYLV